MHILLNLEQDRCPGIPGCYCGKVHGLTVGSFHLARVGGPTAEDEAQGRMFAASPAMVDALRDAESAMFHVLADDGFNTSADRDAMLLAMEGARSVLREAFRVPA